MAEGKSFHSFFLLPILFFAVFIMLYLVPGGQQSIGVYLVSSFFFALALFLSSWGDGSKAGLDLHKGLEYLRLLPLPKGKSWLISTAKWAAAAFLLSCLVTGAVSLILESMGITDSSLVGQKLLTLSIPTLIIAFTLSPLAEEALFRGYFFRKISETAGGTIKPGAAASAAGAAISSLIFALLHFSYGSIAEITVAFFVGLALCFCTRKSGSLFPALAAHAAFNLISIIVTVFL